MKKLNWILGMVALLLVSSVSAQESQAPNANPNSVYPILNHEVMYKKRVWRRMDLKEKQNKPFFAFNNEISKILIEAVKAGLLTPYRNDSLVTRMTKEEFLKNLELPEEGGGLSEEEAALGLDDWGDDSGDDDWGDSDEDTGDEEATVSESADDGNEFFPQQLSILEIQEDAIFDKRRSRMYYDIQSLTMIIPASEFQSTTNLEREVASFKFIDCVSLFRSMPDKAFWFNPQNNGEHRNLSDAFILRLFSANLVKIANPDNAQLADIYNKSPKQALIYSQILEHQMMEWEHNLWSF